MKFPEILAPGGDADSVKAAVLSGADAVYLGLSKFNARRRAVNIGEADLESLVLIAHAHGVRLYITLNVLFTETELVEVFSVVQDCLSAGIDGFIVQDLGLFYILRETFSSAEVHASTQCTTHNSAQIEFLKQLGVKRVNLSRELSLPDIRSLSGKAHEAGVEIEVFVHGAYCVSFSGQCYMSSFMGGQSGNRGLCFQPCRRRYGSSRGGVKQTRLSLKDNNAFAEAVSLIDAGVDSVKIEGRRKNFFYVFSIVSTWKELFSRLRGGEVVPASDERLSQVFNRSFHIGYLKNEIGREFFLESPLDQSLSYLGKVESFTARNQILSLEEPFTAGPGSRLEVYTEDNLFICTAVCEERVGVSSCRIRIENELKGRIEKGQMVALNPYYALMPSVKARIDAMSAEKVPVRVEVSGRPGEPLRALFSAAGREYAALSSLPLSEAEKNPLISDTIKRQFGKLGGTLFSLADVECGDLSPNCFLPVSELNEMRRIAVEHLKPYSASLSAFHLPLLNKAQSADSGFSVILSEPSEVSLFAEKGAAVFLEVNDPADMPLDGLSVPWLPAIVEEKNLALFVSAAKERGVKKAVCNNTGLGLLLAREGVDWVAGPYTNVSNSFACAALRDAGRASGVFLSQELNGGQLNEMLIPEGMASYLTVFGPLLLMTTKQCLSHGDFPCTKSRCDERCFSVCEHYLTWFDERELLFHIVKRPWSYTQIFNDPILSLPQAVRRFWGKFSSFVLDFRRFPFFNLSAGEMEVIFDSFVSLPASKLSIDDCIKPIVPLTTKGNYERGLS
jgi:putative protease